MKKLIFISFTVMTLGLMFQSPMVNADNVTVTGNAKGKATVAEIAPTNQVNANSQGKVTVTKQPGLIEIKGISSAVGVVDTKKVTGSASGTLRISWGNGGSNSSDRFNDDRRSSQSINNRSVFSRLGSPVSPPGAPELPAPILFGSGFLIFGFGLMLYRRLW